MSFRKMHLRDAVKSGEHGTFQRHLSRHCEFSGAHTQDYLELFWVERGPGMHWINGEERELTAGVLQLIRPEDAHGFHALPGGDFGRTPTATMTASRMEYASLQLETTDMKILDLALEIGIQNLGHFYRTFEKHFGCTPREYRLQMMRSGRAAAPLEV